MSLGGARCAWCHRSRLGPYAGKEGQPVAHVVRGGGEHQTLSGAQAAPWGHLETLARSLPGIAGAKPARRPLTRPGGGHHERGAPRVLSSCHLECHGMHTVSGQRGRAQTLLPGS